MNYLERMPHQYKSNLKRVEYGPNGLRRRPHVEAYKRKASVLGWLIIGLMGVIILAFASCVEAGQVSEISECSPETKRIEVTLDVARWFELTKDQAILLLAIHDHELAPRTQMKQCSYFGIRRSIHPILSYCKTDQMEYLVAASICANLIKRHCQDTSPESLKRFNHGYVGKRRTYKGYAQDRLWHIKVAYRMSKYKDIFY